MQMNKNTKLILAIAGVILCISLVSGGLILLLESKEKWPSDDIYVYDSNGYMLYEAGEDIAIDILLCALHRNGKNPMKKYQNVFFETNNGIRYQADLTSDIISSLFNENEIISESVVRFRLNGGFVAGDTLNFKKLVLQKVDGTEIVRDFGNIVIEIIQPSEIKDKIEIEIPSVYSAKLDEFSYTIKNKMKTDIIVQELYLGEGIYYESVPVSVMGSETKEIKVDFSGTEEFNDLPNYVVIKPGFKILEDQGREYVCSAIGMTAYSGNITNEQLRVYLLDYMNKDKIRD